MTDPLKGINSLATRFVMTTDPTRRFAAAFLVVAGCGTASSCEGCGPRSEASAVIDDNDVFVDPAGLVITRDGRDVIAVSAADFAVKTGTAVYDMQFGMFDIIEDDDPFVVGDRLALTGLSGNTLTFDVVVDHEDGDADDEVIASAVVISGNVGAGGDRIGLRLQVTAAGDHNRIAIASPCESGHHFIGLGAQTHDVDHRGQIVPLWVSEQGVGKSDSDELPTVWQLLGRRHTTHVPMPAMVRSDGTAFVASTDAFARFDLCATDETKMRLEVWDNVVGFDVFARDTVLQAQQAMTTSLGRPRLLPPWALAPWNDAIFSQDDVLEYATFLRDNDIPSSALWSEDWRGGRFSGDTYRLDEDWRLDLAQYPDYPSMANALKDQGFAHQVYFNTFATQSGDVAAEIAAGGFDLRSATTGDSFLFAGADRDFSPTALLDLTNDAALEYMKNEHLKPALAAGARGWMADFAEWMPIDDVALASGEDPALVHNRYPQLWQQVNHDALFESGVQDDSVLYYRSGHLGSPPLVDVLWAGDQRTSFADDDGLPTVIPIGLGTGVTGFPFFAHDVGGYQSSTNDPTTKELFFRWTELGAFTAVMRTHHGTHAALNHNLRSDLESTAHWKRYAEIHVRLYPYLRALMRAAVTDDASLAAGHGALPLWAPLPLLFPADEAAWAIKDEFLFGPSLLVAPVVVEGAVSRAVHLPPGRWVAFPMPGAVAGTLGASREEFAGDVDVAAALGEVPVFVAAGGIVPLTATAALTLREVPGIDLDLSSTSGDRTVVVALGNDGRFVEEDGAEYELAGTGTALPAGVDADGSVVVVGNQAVSADGFTFTLRGHPATRTTRVVFR